MQSSALTLNSAGAMPDEEIVVVGMSGLDQDVEVAKCAICLDPFLGDDDNEVLKCGHGFHRECARIWSESHDSCPACVQPLALNAPPENEDLAERSPLIKCRYSLQSEFGPTWQMMMAAMLLTTLVVGGIGWAACAYTNDTPQNTLPSTNKWGFVCCTCGSAGQIAGQPEGWHACQEGVIMTLL
jgi:hypothetical protein